MAAILDPITIRGLTIRNRVVMPPIVIFKAGDDGMATDAHVSHYRLRAMGGVGLVIVEATCVLKEGRLSRNQLGLWSDEHIPGMARLAAVCREAGARVIVQIHHAGLKTAGGVTEDPIAPSAQGDAREMTSTEIASVRRAFIDAAVRARKAGFDGVELHAAHGYLLDQFASPRANRRTDAYGGNLEGRTRLVREIIAGIREEVDGGRFVICCRMGCNEPAYEDGIEIARRLEEAGIDLLHVSAGMEGDGEPEVPAGFDGNWILYGGTLVKRHVSVPVIVVNGIRTHEQASRLLDGHADLVALCRGLLVDPDWPRKAETGEEIVTCLECKPRCRWFDDSSKCPRFRESWLA